MTKIVSNLQVNLQPVKRIGTDEGLCEFFRSPFRTAR